MTVEWSGESTLGRCYVIAEAGVNHNGSEDLAVRLVEAAADAGADAVKFQTFKASSLVKPSTRTAAYQKTTTGMDDQFEMLRALELSPEIHETIVERCRTRSIDFLSTPFDIDSADFLISLGMKKIKVPSGELTNLPLLRELANRGLPMIVSTGMASLEEVEEAVVTIRRSWKRDAEPDLTVLHCTSSYPAPTSEVNLRAMETMSHRFGVPVGYSDHTEGILVPVAAVAMGATVLEKHFTVDRTLPGPDHRMSLEPGELKRMIDEIRHVELALGTGEKAPRPGELEVRDLVRRSVTLCVDADKGTVLEPRHLTLLRPGTGIKPADLNDVVGRRTARALPRWTTLQWEDLD